jgi:hypothetical protein
MTPQAKQLRIYYEKYAFAEVEPAEGGGFVIRVIKAHKGKTPIYGYVCYGSGSPYKWDTQAEAMDFLADALGDL